MLNHEEQKADGKQFIQEIPDYKKVKNEEEEMEELEQKNKSKKQELRERDNK